MIKSEHTELQLCQIIKSGQNEWSLSQLKKWSQNLFWLFQMIKNGQTELQLCQIIKSGQNEWSLSKLKKGCTFSLALASRVHYGTIQFKWRKKSLPSRRPWLILLLCSLSLQAGACPGDGCYNTVLHPQPSVLSPQSHSLLNTDGLVCENYIYWKIK